MVVYLDGVALINFLVDFLLLVGTNCLCGYPPGWRRSGAAAVLGGVYGGICLLPGFGFLGNYLWRAVCLLTMGWIAFGFSKSAFRRTVIFVFLCMALGGVAYGINVGGVLSVIVSALVVCLLCIVGFRDVPGRVKYVPVELTYGEKRLSFVALEDTGNTLRDPVTGRPVLVVEANVAQKLTGLTQTQLKSPVSAMESGALPGLRLIPYHSVGQSNGMLLALKFPKVKIGKWKGSSLVAFAPDALCSDGRYQALTGGAA